MQGVQTAAGLTGQPATLKWSLWILLDLALGNSESVSVQCSVWEKDKEHLGMRGLAPPPFHTHLQPCALRAG